MCRRVNIFPLRFSSEQGKSLNVYFWEKFGKEEEEKNYRNILTKNSFFLLHV